MLQQTRVNAMLPLYEKFLDRFPDVFSLAKSSEEDVVSAWQGLGYYSRARNLRKAAIYVTQNFNGRFPKELHEMLLIPGIGPYTARAILSIAYDLPHAVLDGNVKRVLARYFLYKDNILGNKADKELQILADSFLNPEAPGDHNQALMELGSSLCLPENPKCLLCPLSEPCLANSENMTDVIPKREKKEKQFLLNGKVLWIQNGNEVLLVRESKQRFLKGMFTLPILFEGELPSVQYEPDKRILQLFRSLDFNEKGKIKHTITHHKISLSLEEAVFKPDLVSKINHILDDPIEWKWVDIKNLTAEFPSSIAGKVLKYF